MCGIVRSGDVVVDVVFVFSSEAEAEDEDEDEDAPTCALVFAKLTGYMTQLAMALLLAASRNVNAALISSSPALPSPPAPPRHRRSRLTTRSRKLCTLIVRLGLSVRTMLAL